jgi:hypothetical protein
MHPFGHNDCDHGPGNPDNYIWSTYLKKETVEDRMVKDIAGIGVVIAILGIFGFFSWLSENHASRQVRPISFKSIKKNAIDGISAIIYGIVMMALIGGLLFLVGVAVGSNPFSSEARSNQPLNDQYLGLKNPSDSKNKTSKGMSLNAEASKQSGEFQERPVVQKIRRNVPTVPADWKVSYRLRKLLADPDGYYVTSVEYRTLRKMVDNCVEQHIPLAVGLHPDDLKRWQQLAGEDYRVPGYGIVFDWE